MTSGVPRQQAIEHPANDRERRAGDRIRTVYRVAKVIREKSEQGLRAIGLWRVRNISDSGMMMRTALTLASGERLSIELSERVVMEGRVIWCRNGHCGVEFDRPIDSAQALQTLAIESADPAYRPARLPVDMRAVAYCERGIQPVRVTDVSQRGVGFVHDGSFRPGMQVMILLENGGERRGIVRWSNADHAGMLLVEPVGDPELEEAGPMPQRLTDGRGIA